jgi:hypothetical protein
MDTKSTFCLSKTQSKCIFFISFISLFTCIYGLYNGHTDVALIVPGLVFITSTLNWYEPLYDWRRYLDICYVVFAYIYAVIRAINSTNELLFNIFMIIAIICFFIGYICIKYDYCWNSVYFHMGVHICANIALLALFSGNIVPISESPIFNYFL